MHAIPEMTKPRVLIYTDWQIFLLDVFLWPWSRNDWFNQPNKLLSATVSPLFYL